MRDTEHKPIYTLSLERLVPALDASNAELKKVTETKFQFLNTPESITASKKIEWGLGF